MFDLVTPRSTTGASELVKVLYTLDEEPIRVWLSLAAQKPYLGFDTETRPNHRKGERRNPTDLLQLCTPDGDALLLNFYQLDKPARARLRPVLESLLRDPRVLKLGCSVRSDFWDLVDDWNLRVGPRSDPCGIVDIGRLCSSDKIRFPPPAEPGAKLTVGLGGMCERYLGVTLNKKVKGENWRKKIAVSNWACPFPMSQKWPVSTRNVPFLAATLRLTRLTDYAVLDAWAGCRMFENMAAGMPQATLKTALKKQGVKDFVFDPAIAKRTLVPAGEPTDSQAGRSDEIAPQAKVVVPAKRKERDAESDDRGSAGPELWDEPIRELAPVASKKRHIPCDETDHPRKEVDDEDGELKERPETLDPAVSPADDEETRPLKRICVPGDLLVHK